MEQTKLDMFIMQNSKYIPADKVIYLKEKLKNIDDEKYLLVTSVELKDPTTMLILSLFLGSLGVDRFMLGDTGMGVLKLLTGGCCGILTIVDWFGVQNKTKELNFNKLMAII